MQRHPLKVFLVYAAITFTGASFAQESTMESLERLLEAQIPLTEKGLQLEAFLETQQGIAPMNLADAYYESSKWMWGTKRDQSKAKTYARKERELRKQLITDSLDPKVLRNLYNLGYMYHHGMVPDYPNSLAFFDTLVGLTPSKDVRLGNVYRERGDIFDALGDFQRALENYAYSESVFQELNRPDLQLKTRINISGTYVSIGDGNYLEDFNQNNAQIEALGNEIISENQQAMVTFNTAAMYHLAGKNDIALPELERSLSLFKKTKDSLNTYKALSLLGIIFQKQGHYLEAERIFWDTQSYAGKDPLLQSAVFNNLADCYQRQQNWKKAIQFYYRALYTVLGKTYHETAAQSLTYEEIQYAPFKKIIFGYLADITEAFVNNWEQEKNVTFLNEAENLFQIGDQVVDDLFLESREEVSKLAWREKASKLYLQGVVIYEALQQPQKAFYLMEKNKGLLLLENIHKVLAREKAKIPMQFVDKEYAFLGQIKQLQLEWAASVDPEEKTALGAQIFQLKTTFRQFMDDLELKFPVYFTHKRQFSIVSLDEVQQDLGPDEMVLEYLLGDEKGYVLLISGTDSYLKRMPSSRSQLEIQFKAFRELLDRPWQNKEDVKSYRSKAFKLYETLFPFESLRESIKGKRLMIIPDGPLHRLPFEALVVAEDLPFPEAYLIAQSDVWYQYSLTVNAQIKKLPTNPETAWAGFFLTQFQEDYQTPLVFGTKEQAYLSPFFEGDKNFKNEKASKASFLSAYQRFPIVHVSTHGGVDSEGPWLAFYDAPLFLNELYFLESQKEMVVLSACKTSEGLYANGEGVFSITRGFINSGSKSVVSSLWNLNDKSSFEVLSHFYVELQQGASKSKALRSAKLEYLRTHLNSTEGSPFYWASIILTGNDEPLPIQENHYWILGLLALGLLGGFLLWFFRYR